MNAIAVTPEDIQRYRMSVPDPTIIDDMIADGEIVEQKENDHHGNTSN